MQSDTQGQGGRPLPSRAELGCLRAEFVDRERRKAGREGRPFPPGEAFRRAPDNLTRGVWQGRVRRAEKGQLEMTPEWLDPELGFERFVVAMGERPPGCNLGHPEVTRPIGPDNARWEPATRREHLSPVTPAEREVRRRTREVLAAKHGLDPRSLERRKGNYLYTTWDSICDRCNDPDDPAYRNYGGDGVSIHEDWDDSRNAGFEVFAAYIISTIGHRPSEEHSIDRRNPHGDYEPGNLRWETPKGQANNKKPKGEPGEPRPMGRRATEEAELKRAFLREDEAASSPHGEVDRGPWDD